MTKNNMEIWNSVCETSPEYTTKVKQRGGFTAICAMSQIQEATRQFGAVGVGWGWDYELIFPPNDTVIANITLWHGNREQVVKQAGQKSLNSSYGVDEDAVKKAITDGLTKCLSYLGFNADVFLGKFDDNKYVAEMKEKHKEKPKEDTPEEKKAKEMAAMAWVEGKQVDISALETEEDVLNFPKAHSQMVNRLSNYPNVEGALNNLLADRLEELKNG